MLHQPWKSFSRECVKGEVKGRCKLAFSSVGLFHMAVVFLQNVFCFCFTLNLNFPGCSHVGSFFTYEEFDLRPILYFHYESQSCF